MKSAHSCESAPDVPPLAPVPAVPPAPSSASWLSELPQLATNIPSGITSVDGHLNHPTGPNRLPLPMTRENRAKRVPPTRAVCWAVAAAARTPNPRRLRRAPRTRPQPPRRCRHVRRGPARPPKLSLHESGRDRRTEPDRSQTAPGDPGRRTRLTGQGGVWAERLQRASMRAQRGGLVRPSARGGFRDGLAWRLALLDQGWVRRPRRHELTKRYFYDNVM